MTRLTDPRTVATAFRAVPVAGRLRVRDAVPVPAR